MKTWENAMIEEITFKATENGGKPSMDFDQQWYDQNGALHVNFAQS